MVRKMKNNEIAYVLILKLMIFSLNDDYRHELLQENLQIFKFKLYYTRCTSQRQFNIVNALSMVYPP